MAHISATAEKLEAVLAGTGTRTIGALVFWSLSGVDCSRVAFREAFEAIGMGAAVPRDPRESTLLTTAVRLSGTGKANVLWRRAGKGWALVLEEAIADPDRPETTRLAHTHVATVTIDTHREYVKRALAQNPNRLAPELQWRFQGKPAQVARAQVIAAELEQHYHQTKHFMDTADLSVTLVNLMHGTSRDTLLGAVSLRQSTGGLYFVHSSKVEQARQVRDLVHQLASKSSVVVMAITGEAENLEAAAQAAKLGFASQLNELRAEVTKFLAETPRHAVSDRNVSVRVDRYKQLSTRVEIFRDILGSVAGELGNQIEAARKDLEREVGL